MHGRRGKQARQPGITSGDVVLEGNHVDEKKKKKTMKNGTKIENNEMQRHEILHTRHMGVIKLFVLSSTLCTK